MKSLLGFLHPCQTKTVTHNSDNIKEESSRLPFSLFHFIFKNSFLSQNFGQLNSMVNKLGNVGRKYCGLKSFENETSLSRFGF